MAPTTHPVETELKLQLRAADLPRLLAHPLLAANALPRQRLRNTYFDTADLQLMQQRIAVRERRVGPRTLLTVKTAGSSVGGLSRRGEWEGPTRPGQPDFAALVSDAALAQELEALAPRLQALFHTDFTRRRWLIAHGGAQIEVALDQGEIRTDTSAGARHEPILELELELRDGPVQSLFDLALALSDEPDGAGLWLMPADRSKAERGLALFQGRTPAPRKATATTLHADMDPVSALQVAALDSLAQLQDNLAGLLQPLTPGQLPDPEFVHQARVALRRLRSGLSLFADHLPKAFVRRWGPCWQRSAAVLGEARNWDVLDDHLLQWLGERALRGLTPDALAPLAQWVLAQRLDAQQQVLAHLQTPDLTRQLLAFAADLQTLRATRPRGDLAGWAASELDRRLRRLQRQARRAHRLDLDELHALRIRLKKLRYAQGFLQGLLPPEQVRQLPVLARLQDAMGELNDRVTALRLLQDCPLTEAAAWRRQLEREQTRILQGLPRLQHTLEALRGH